MTRSLLVLAAVACFAAAPVIAQQPANASAKPAAHAAQPVAGGGPRLQQDFHSYQPALAHETATSSNAAAATTDNVVITISTVGLVLLGVLLILLLT